MKRLLLALPLLALSLVAHANCAYVKTVACSGVSCTFTPTNAGDLIIPLSMTSAGAGNPTASITDNLSSSYGTAQASFADADNDFITAFYLPNASASITTITFSYAGGTPGTVNDIVVEYSGIATSSPLNQTTKATQTNPGTGANAVSSGTVTTTSSPTCFIGAFFSANGHAMTAGTSPLAFTLRYSDASAWSVEDIRLTTTATDAVTAGDSGGAADQTSAIAMAFIEPAGGAAKAPPLSFLGVGAFLWQRPVNLAALAH